MTYQNRTSGNCLLSHLKRFSVLFVSSPSYTSKVPEQRLDESNVGHQMLKKMGEFNSLVRQCDLRAIVVRVT